MPTALFSISLTFRNFTIDPDIITATLKLEPSRHWGAGDRVPKLDGTPGRYRDPESAWLINASFYEADDDVDEQLSAFLEPLARQHSFVRELAASANAHIDLEFPGQFHFGCVVRPGTLIVIANLGLELGIEVFPDSAT